MTAFRLACLGVLAAFSSHAADPLKLERTIPLPGVEGRIDHMAVDVLHRRLFVAALGNNTVEVLDLDGGKRIRSITGLHEPQGIAYVPAPSLVYVANGEDGKLKVFDGVSFELRQTIDFSGDADNVRYDPDARQIYVGYGSGALGIVDLLTRRKVGDVALAGHPESFQLEQSGTRIFINVPTAGHVAIVDRRARSLTLKWPLPGKQANFPMALNEAGHRLFIGCREPPHVAVFDTNTGKIVATFECVDDTDDLFYDAALKRLYISGGEGFITVIQEQDGNTYHPLARIATASGARTSLFVPALKRLYLAVPHRGKQGAEIRVYQALP
jgi:DNA-binding beta-propeller fold protein YncE